MPRRNSRANTAAIGAACLAAAPLLIGCAADPRLGYSFNSTWDDQNIASVAVPLFQNTTPTRGLELHLTEAVNKQIQSRTPWSIQPDAVADTVLTGTITNAGLRRLSTDRGTGLSEEFAYTVTVSIEWKDARTGEVLTARRDIRGSGTFVPEIRTGGTVGQGNEPIEIGQLTAINAAATQIVNALRAGW